MADTQVWRFFTDPRDGQRRLLRFADRADHDAGMVKFESFVAGAIRTPGDIVGGWDFSSVIPEVLAAFVLGLPMTTGDVEATGFWSANPPVVQVVDLTGETISPDVPT